MNSMMRRGLDAGGATGSGTLEQKIEFCRKFIILL
jgi:hypothetical protein